MSDDSIQINVRCIAVELKLSPIRNLRDGFHVGSNLTVCHYEFEFDEGVATSDVFLFNPSGRLEINDARQ